MISELYLDIPTNKNTKLLKINDSSLYNPEIEVQCGQILIIPPGFSFPVGFNVDPFFSLIINSASLGLTEPCRTCELQDIPDGIYILNYSIAPNDDLYVEYNHMRVALLEKKYTEALCSLYTREGSYRTDEFNQELKKLRYIKRLIDSSVLMVEQKHFNEKGLELYDKANSELDKYKNKLSKCKNC